MSSDEVTGKIVAEDAILRVAIANLMAKPAVEFGQELLSIGLHRIKEEGGVDRRIVAMKRLLELRTIGLPLGIAEETHSCGLSRQRIHRSLGKTSIWRSGHDDCIGSEGRSSLGGIDRTIATTRLL